MSFVGSANLKAVAVLLYVSYRCRSDADRDDESAISFRGVDGGVTFGLTEVPSPRRQKLEFWAVYGYVSRDVDTNPDSSCVSLMFLTCFVLLVVNELFTNFEKCISGIQAWGSYSLLKLRCTFWLFEFVASTTFIFESYPSNASAGCESCKGGTETHCRCCLLQSRFSHSHICAPSGQSAKHNFGCHCGFWNASTFGMRRSSTELNCLCFKVCFQHELAKTWSFGPRTHCDLGCYFVPYSSTTSMTHPTTKWPSTVNAC